ncbi:MAG TPA: hypothetical protein EYG51_25095 [Pseudomonadales bacterium]|nr:hypothetical protein [Pseudomonadales bacterium]
MVKKLTERTIIEAMRDEYTKLLSRVVREADVFDDRGNMVLGKDLKVHHKESGLEYTVDDVVSDAQGKVKIVLRLPDEPRFEPPGEEGILSDSPNLEQHLSEDDLLAPESAIGDLSLASKQEEPLPTRDEFEDTEVFVIDQEEFEKEYEVK